MARAGNNHKGGRPKGKRNAATLEKEAVMKAYQQRVMRSTDRILNVQLGLAHGSTYLMKIEKEVIIGPKGGKTYKSKKAELVTDLQEIKDYLDGLTVDGDQNDPSDPGATYYYMTAKDPDRQAAADMLDRTFGKSTGSVMMDITSDGEKLQTFNEPQLKRIASRLSHGGKPVKK